MPTIAAVTVQNSPYAADRTLAESVAGVVDALNGAAPDEWISLTDAERAGQSFAVKAGLVKDVGRARATRTAGRARASARRQGGVGVAGRRLSRDLGRVPRVGPREMTSRFEQPQDE
jgi:hypothetical protein